MERYINQSVRMMDAKNIDTRELTLYIQFNLTSLEEFDKVIEETYNMFAKPFEKGYILDKGCCYKYGAALKRFVDLSKESIRRKGYMDYTFEGVKKSEKIKSMKDMLESDEMIISSISFQDEREKRRQELLGIENNIDYKKIFSDILEYDAIPRGGRQVYDVGAIMSFGKPTIERKDISLYQGYFTLTFNVDALGNNIEKAANHLKAQLIEICKNHPYSNGFVGIKSCPYISNSDKTYYFYEHDDGYAYTDMFGEIEEFDYLDLMFIDGLEWANVMPTLIADRVDNIDEIMKDYPNISFKKINEDICILESNKPILEHRQKDYGKLFKHLDKWVRPGYFSCDILDVRKWMEDLYFDESEYEIVGDKVYFSRGNFDFITRKK